MKNFSLTTHNKPTLPTISQPEHDAQLHGTQPLIAFPAELNGQTIGKSHGLPINPHITCITQSMEYLGKLTPPSVGSQSLPNITTSQLPSKPPQTLALGL
jgi:hypothetical protein